ncbi:hypothetical protein A6A40_23875 (plasmid) [Azospirillum humicireducens]|uniref:NAD-dependent epimerase/dehydratase domain-containing protein n=1 Tax=Azospirillum humicireducens TaxID=1226968 RepID=A0A2R4VUM3_9PROT|nr:NAD(P)-dependent oxidoreductase [Azospirillum humicireducens]AWB08081.1 hypothetical protein A6A40_23875 [Azospirillum humicireducens]
MMGMQKHVVLTGVTGLIGRHLLPLLQEHSYNVTALVRAGKEDTYLLPPSVRPVEADLRGDFTSVLRNIEPADVVIHLAQHPGFHAFPDQAANVFSVSLNAAIHLAEFAKYSGARFLYASSGGVCGPSPEPVREDYPLRPQKELGFYLSTKMAAENLLGFFRQDMQVSILRFFFVYGPGQGNQFLFPRLITSISEGKPITLANGCGPRLNPIHASDAAKAVMAAVISMPEILHIAGPEVKTLKSICEILGDLLKRSPVFIDKPPPALDYIADTALMERLCGQATGLRAGLTALINNKSEKPPV